MLHILCFITPIDELLSLYDAHKVYNSICSKVGFYGAVVAFPISRRRSAVLEINLGGIRTSFYPRCWVELLILCALRRFRSGSST